MSERDRPNERGGEIDPTRRRVIAAAGLVGTTALAGCLGGGSGDGTDTGDGAGSGDGSDGSTDGSGTDGNGMNDGTETGRMTGDGGMGDGTGTDADDGSNDGMGSGTDDSMSSGTDHEMGSSTDDGMGDGTATSDGGSTASGWLGHELTDVTTGETFTVGQFDKPVVVETFAVWCPKCTSQQEQLAKLRSRMGEDVVLVSLNTDPNESASKVRDHVSEHGFGWRYAVAPADLTKSLVDRFGAVVSTAPAAPVIVVCPDGSATLMDKRGVKSVDTVAKRVEDC